MAKQTKPTKRRRPATNARRRKPAASNSVVVEVANHHRRHAVQTKSLREAVETVVAGEKCSCAKISVVVVDDATIHNMNCEFLEHDEPTDVLSFLFESNDSYVEGEVVASADTAAKTARRFGWTRADELLLYVIHGTLHLFGYDDQSPTKQRKMRERERFYLKQFGLEPQYVEVKSE
jgi:probable rRNA maturation factor